MEQGEQILQDFEKEYDTDAENARCRDLETLPSYRKLPREHNCYTSSNFVATMFRKPSNKGL